MVELNEIERRVLGVLIEKDFTTPEYYPLSLNATVNACNQKSSRDPVMELSEADVRTALYELDNRGLARTLSDARVAKFEHRAYDVLKLRRDEVAILCLLLLRGAQTAPELRMRAERMYAFEDNAAAQSTLERMAAREEPLTVLLPKQPGAREARWMHLLGGQPSISAAPSAPHTPAFSDSNLLERLEALEELTRSLEARIRQLEGNHGNDEEGARQLGQ